MSAVESSNSPISSKWNVKTWDGHVETCKRDLIIKKIALALLVLLNLAGIAGLCTYIVLYSPISQSAIEVSCLITPIIIGVFAAFSMLKIPTFGFTSYNYKQVLNPITTIVKIATLALIAPVYCMVQHVDFTDYADHFEAKNIVKEIEIAKFDKVMEVFGPRIDNLVKYGYISQTNGTAFEKIYSQAEPLLAAKEDLKNRERVKDAFKENFDQLQVQLQPLEKEWEELKSSILPDLPNPEVPNPDFTKWTARAAAYFRSLDMKQLRKIKLH